MAQGAGAQKRRESIGSLDKRERDRLVMENLPEISYIARRIHNRIPEHVDFEDLVESGVVGLLEAMNHYDPKRNIKLMTYAKLRIEGAMLDSLRDLDWSPRELRRKGRQLDDTLHLLRSRIGRPPARDEVADAMGMSLASFNQLLFELRGLELGSLEAMTSPNERGDQPFHSIPSNEEDPLGLCMESEWRALLAEALRDLPKRDRDVIALYYVEELTMREIGALLGVGEGRISQIHAAAILRLRSRLEQAISPLRTGQKQAMSPNEIPEWSTVESWMISAAA